MGGRSMGPPTLPTGPIYPTRTAHQAYPRAKPTAPCGPSESTDRPTDPTHGAHRPYPRGPPTLPTGPTQLDSPTHGPHLVVLRELLVHVVERAILPPLRIHGRNLPHAGTVARRCLLQRAARRCNMLHRVASGCTALQRTHTHTHTHSHAHTLFRLAGRGWLGSVSTP
jgi:hypothetical protein